MHHTAFRRAPLALGICLALPLAAAVNAAPKPAVADDKMESVLVRGERIKQELEAEQALTPGSVTVVDGADLTQRNVVSLADMLRYVPGMWAASGVAGDSTFLSSRGSNLDATNYDGNGIKLLQDGLPVTTADGNNHNRDIDPLSASYIIVAHGANALTYGASTLGGAIDFITPTARDTPSQLLFNGGSNGQLQGRATVGTVDGAFDGLITLEARRYDGYRDHQQQERESIYANAGWQFSDAVQTRLYLTYIDNDQELPGALTRDEWRSDPEQAQATARTGNFQLNVETWRIANKTTWDINENSSLSVGLSYEEQKLYHPIVDKVMVDFDGPGPLTPVEVFSLLINTEQDNYGTAVRYNLHLGEHELLAGLNYSETTVKGGNYRNDGGRRNGLSTHIDNAADSLELFAVDRWQFAPQWTLMYGAQGVFASRDVRNIDVPSGSVTNPNADFHSVNPRAGLTYQVTPDIELFANLSRLYEAPTNFELQDDVANNASGGNHTLDAMHGTVLEVGTRGKQALGDVNQWHWDVALYYAQLHDEILSVDDPAAPGTSLSKNVDDTIHAGIEALIGASFALDAGGTQRIEPLINVTINDFSFDNDAVYGNNELPAAPGYAIKGEILYRNANGFFAGPTFDIVDKRYADFNNTYEVASYTLLGLRTGFARDSWEVFGEIRNLTDKKYISLFSVKDVAAPNAAILTPGEPRSAYVGVKLKF